jgi:alpha/beta hydrolase fold
MCDIDGCVWRVQNHLSRLPDASRSPISHWPGRLHESVEGDRRDQRSEKAGALRQLRRCRHGAALILRAREGNLPLPAAIAIGTPWADLTETGDTFETNEWLDNIIVSYRGYLNRAARLYADGNDLKDPHLSPIYGDFHGFPPTVLTSATRDLLLSLTVLTHRKLRRSNVEAELNVFEGMSHIAPASPGL